MLGMMMVERDRGWGRRGTTKGGNGRGKSSRIEGMVGYMGTENGLCMVGMMVERDHVYGEGEGSHVVGVMGERDHG